jgi:lysophospholipase L1-like esterase
MERRLAASPLFEHFDDAARLRALAALGASLGNRAKVFTTVGDSNTSNGDFLQPIGMGADVYCNWGDYADLHATVAFFSAPVDEESANSFVHHSLAAKKGLTSAGALDPFWVDDTVCAANESPLVCEYRTAQPAVAIIMLGNIDINSLTTAEYAANMRTIVDTTLQRGIIPVLTTFVVIPERDTVYERSLEMNMALLDLADAENVPLINLWTAVQALPDHGIGPDHTHLKAVVGSFCSFDGAQNQYGGTLRNLLTLQALDRLRKDVLTS